MMTIAFANLREQNKQMFLARLLQQCGLNERKDHVMKRSGVQPPHKFDNRFPSQQVCAPGEGV